MEIGKSFINLDSYLENMAKGLEDKLFFMKYLPRNKNYIFLDFGCADGSLLQVLYHNFGNKHIYVGYDISEQMIELANTKSFTNEILFTSDWKVVVDKIEHSEKHYKVVTILSSVVHEIYSYAKSEYDIKSTFLNIINYSDYICVRDMMYSKDLDRYADDEIYSRFPKDSEKDVFLRDFEDRWGSIRNMKNLVHYLLKYKWKTNWKREVNENYFPVSIEDFLNIFKRDFNLIYFERFRVPYLEQYWKKDFDIELDDYTHLKAIFKLQI